MSVEARSEMDTVRAYCPLGPPKWKRVDDTHPTRIYVLCDDVFGSPMLRMGKAAHGAPRASEGGLRGARDAPKPEEGVIR